MTTTSTFARYRRGAVHRLLLTDYRHLQRWYWELRTPELHANTPADPVEAELIRDVIARYDIESVIDLGCGTGRLFPAFKDAGVRRLVGVDIASRALAIAGRLHPDVPTLRVRAKDLDPWDRFDAIFVNRVLQHLDPVELPPTLDRVCSVARKAIYLNEIGPSENANLTGARYMFEHDYVALMSARGWVLAESNFIGDSNKRYLVFVPGPAYRYGGPDTPPASALARTRQALRALARPLQPPVLGLGAARLRAIYLVNGIEGIQIELRKLRSNHAAALRQFGADVSEDVSMVGPVSLVNSARDFSNLSIAGKTHIGSEVLFDLADKVTVEEGATLSMRVSVITHLDVGRGPLIHRRPRQVGPVRIGKGAFIGAGAIILHGVTIGPEAVIGAGVVVTRDVPAGTVVARSGSWLDSAGKR